MAFEQKYQHHCHGEANRLEPDGQETHLACYELVLDLQNNEQRAATITQFMLSAAQAGYSEALGPVVLPPGEKDGVFGSIFLTLQKPAGKPSTLSPTAAPL